MGLLNTFDRPVFLKEDSDTIQFLCRLKELQTQASGKAKYIIDREIKLASMGEIGEKNIAFELKNSGMPMYIMHDMYFEINGLSAQVDYIVVTRKITFIIECKNLIGDIDIDSEGNFIRKYELNGKRIKEGIYSPITQNQRHLEILRQIKRESKGNMLSKMLFDKYFDENYKSIVVLANPKTVLNARYAKKEVKQMVIRADQLNKYIKNVYQQSKQPVLNDRDMKEFAEGLLALHTPNKSDYAKKYELLLKNISDADKQTHNKAELIKQLKEFRLQRSREEKIKPYYIFSDKQMMDLIDKMPNSKEELLQVSGFGEVKTEKYGDVILKIISGYS